MQKLAGMLLGLLWISVVTQVQAAIPPKAYQMMLMGSEFELCRSSATRFCLARDAASFVRNKSRSAIQYKLAIPQIEKMMRVERWAPSRQALRYDLHLLFNAIAKRTGTRVLSYPQLLSAWKSTSIKRDGKTLSGHSLFLSMTESELAMILDHLEFAQVDHANRRVKESVIINPKIESPSINFAKQVIRLSKSKDKPANILVATLGYRDSFADVDAYIALFGQLGADVNWLPIDAALNRLLHDGARCEQLTDYRAKFMQSYDRKRIYNDLIDLQLAFCRDSNRFNKAINQADIVVLVGDKPRLLKASLMNNNQESSLLSLIRQRMKKNQLAVVAVANMAKGMVGKSQSGAVILSGNSEYAMLNGTLSEAQKQRTCKDYGSCEQDYNTVVYQQGGLGLIDFPVVDIQVSSHGNIARLAKVAVDSGHKRSLSIDKETAVLISPQQRGIVYQVIGQHGVMYLEQKALAKGLTNIDYHYFTPQDNFVINDEQLSAEYPSWKTVAKDPDAQLAHYNNLFYGDNFKRFTEQACVINEKQWSGLAGRNKQFMIEVAKTPNSELHMGGLKVNDGYQFYCSINALSLTLKRN